MRVEGTDRLIALEHAVAQRGDVDVVIIRPHGQILLISIIYLPYAIFNGRYIDFVDRILRHAAADGVVDPHRAVRALILEQRGIRVAVFDAAVPRQIQVGDAGIHKRIRRDVDHLIEIKHEIIQPRIGKGARADGFHAAAQVQFLTPCAFKRALSDGFDRRRERQNALLAVPERPRADFLQALVPVDQVDLGVKERIVADGFERGGEMRIAKVAGVLERAGVNALQSLREDDAVHGVIAREGFLTDGLHRHAADGRGDLDIGVIFLVAGNRAGGSIERKPVLIACRFRDDSVFAAGLKVLRRAVGVFERLRVSVQLIIRYVDHIAVAQPVKAPAGVQEERACALKSNLLQAFTGANRAIHNANAGRNGQCGQRIAVAEIGADVLQTIVERHAGQAVHPGDGPALERAQRVGHRQRGDLMVRLKGVVPNGIGRIAVHLRGDRHVAAERAGRHENHVAIVVRPLRLVRQCGYARKHKQCKKQSDDSFFQVKSSFT